MSPAPADRPNLPVPAGAGDRLPTVHEAADQAGSIIREQVRAISEAAVANATQIVRRAHEDAEAVRERAAARAGRVRARVEEIAAWVADSMASLHEESEVLAAKLDHLRALTSQPAAAPPREPEPAAGSGQAPPPPAPPSPGFQRPAGVTRFRRPPFGRPVTPLSEVPAAGDVPPGARLPVEEEVLADAQVTAEPPAAAPEPGTGAPVGGDQPSTPPPGAVRPWERYQEPITDAQLAEDEEGTEEPVVRWSSAPAGDVDADRQRMGLFRRRRMRRVEEIGHCAVCNRVLPAPSPEERNVRICAQCQSEGWQLSEEGSLPFRRP